MTILVVEDLPEQIEIAKRELTSLGYKVAVARTLEDAQRLMEDLKSVLKGIITDLHFPENASEMSIKRTSDKPSGLAVVASAVLVNIPVAVCSDINHHFCAYVKDIITVLATHQCYTHGRIPFIQDRKDWRRAGQELMELIKQTHTE